MGQKEREGVDDRRRESEVPISDLGPSTENCYNPLGSPS